MDEVDSQGDVTRENVYSRNKKVPPKKSDKPMPQNFGELDSKQIPMATDNYKRAELQEATGSAAEDMIGEEKSNPSETIEV
jgi:hypothetical protein